MDDLARVTAREDSDLASIVLGNLGSDGRRLDGPERVPAWVGHAPTQGYDVRSIAVLALVVAVLAATVGWVTTLGASQAPPEGAAEEASTSSSASVPPDNAFGDAIGSARSVVERSESSAKPTPAAPVATGANLAAGRLVASRSGSGTGLVTLSVRNSGDGATDAAGTEVLVLVDGAVMGSGRLAGVAAGASARVQVPLDWCPAGTAAIVAIVDPGSVVREANERDNSVSRSAAFGC